MKIIFIRAKMDGIAADGIRKQVKEVANELETIPFNDGIQIEISNKGKTGGYSFYNQNLEQVYYSKEKFEVPQGEGEYYVYFEVSWGNRTSNSAYQYFFKYKK